MDGEEQDLMKVFKKDRYEVKQSEHFNGMYSVVKNGVVISEPHASINRAGAHIRGAIGFKTFRGNVRRIRPR